MKKYGYEFEEEQLTKTAQVEDRLDILTHIKDQKKVKRKDTESSKMDKVAKGYALDFTDPACAD